MNSRYNHYKRTWFEIKTEQAKRSQFQIKDKTYSESFSIMYKIIIEGMINNSKTKGIVPIRSKQIWNFFAKLKVKQITIWIHKALSNEQNMFDPISFEPKNQQKYFCISALASKIGRIKKI